MSSKRKNSKLPSTVLLVQAWTGLLLVAAGRVHEPEPEVVDSSRAATAREQDSDPDRWMVSSAECRA
jgi:hypothetical protein